MILLVQQCGRNLLTTQSCSNIEKFTPNSLSVTAKITKVLLSIVLMNVRDNFGNSKIL